MRNLLLVFSCLFLVFLCPVDIQREADCMDDAVQISQVGESAGSNVSTIYDEDAITLLATFSSPNNDLATCRVNHWGRQLRTLTYRFQLRSSSLVLLVKKLTQFLSAHLTNLVHHNSQVYSSFKPLSWQYAVDCYVYSFRQILI